MVGIYILLTLILLFNALPVILSLLGPKPLKPLQFENDMVFLNYIIGTKISDYEKYVITPAKAAGRALMTDADLKDEREKFVIEVFSCLNPDYLRVLYKYFSQDGLRFYIVNTINNELSDLLLKHNMKFFSNAKSNDTQNIRKTDIE